MNRHVAVILSTVFVLAAVRIMGFSPVETAGISLLLYFGMVLAAHAIATASTCRGCAK